MRSSERRGPRICHQEIAAWSVKVYMIGDDLWQELEWRAAQLEAIFMYQEEKKVTEGAEDK